MQSNSKTTETNQILCQLRWPAAGVFRPHKSQPTARRSMWCTRKSPQTDNVLQALRRMQWGLCCLIICMKKMLIGREQCSSSVTPVQNVQHQCKLHNSGLWLAERNRVLSKPLISRKMITKKRLCRNFQKRFVQWQKIASEKDLWALMWEFRRPVMHALLARVIKIIKLKLQWCVRLSKSKLISNTFYSYFLQVGGENNTAFSFLEKARNLSSSCKWFFLLIWRVIFHNMNNCTLISSVP